MLVESIIRVGEPIKVSNISNEKRIRLLTDCDNNSCKNFFQNVFLIELDEKNIAYHFLKVGTGKEDFEVDKKRNTAYPIFYPQGGNPLRPQGFYPIPCYLMFDKHIKGMNDAETFAKKEILPRLERTIFYMEYDKNQLKDIAQKVANILADNYKQIIDIEKQLGILYIYDHSLSSYYCTEKQYKEESNYFWIAESKLKSGQHLYLDSEKCIENIIKAKFNEAKTLGWEQDAISTFSNKSAEVVSIYNKYWPWLSPTWEPPRSIYWSKSDWTPGIKIDRKNYESYLYGAQFLNQITLPISSSILKEMFAPIMNVEAKKNMSYSSFQQIYGIPIVLPLIEDNPQQVYKKYEFLLKKHDKEEDADIHLNLIAGIDKALPKIDDEYRLTLLYYSGDITRGDVHIRAIIEDVIPSVARKVERIIKDIENKEVFNIKKAFGISEDRKLYSLDSLPSMLGNAYGPGYVWSSMEKVFNKKAISVDILHRSMAIKLNELANKEDYWAMKNELIFYHGFLIFYNRYNSEVRNDGEEVNTLSDWEQLLEKYHLGEIKVDDLKTAENLGYVAGLTLKQFSNSYHYGAGSDFIKHRVMKFGSKLTPEMIWKDGLLRCEELAMQRGLGLANNFRHNLANVLLAMLEAEQNGILNKHKDQFMTAFWSGYLMYKKQEEV